MAPQNARSRRGDSAKTCFHWAEALFNHPSLGLESRVTNTKILPETAHTVHDQDLAKTSLDTIAEPPVDASYTRHHSRTTILFILVLLRTLL